MSRFLRTCFSSNPEQSAHYTLNSVHFDLFTQKNAIKEMPNETEFVSEFLVSNILSSFSSEYFSGFRKKELVHKKWLCHALAHIFSTQLAVSSSPSAFILWSIPVCNVSAILRKVSILFDPRHSSSDIKLIKSFVLNLVGSICRV